MLVRSINNGQQIVLPFQQNRFICSCYFRTSDFHRSANWNVLAWPRSRSLLFSERLLRRRVRSRELLDLGIATAAHRWRFATSGPTVMVGTSLPQWRFRFGRAWRAGLRCVMGVSAPQNRIRVRYVESRVQRLWCTVVSTWGMLTLDALIHSPQGTTVAAGSA